MTSAKPIAHFERKYSIHPDGRVWNHGKEAWQSQTMNPNGYMKVQLQMNGECSQLLVHRLVALHFLPNPYGHEQVNHIDGDKTNNAVGNLEWVSREQNIQHSLKAGLRRGFMSPEERRPLLDRVLAGEMIGPIADEIGRGREVLTKMLRDQAIKDGRQDDWSAAMKQRRRDAAIRNIQGFNSRDRT